MDWSSFPILDERLCSHCLRLRDTHKLEDGRSDIAKGSVLHALHLLTGIHDDERHVIERVGGVRGSVLIESVVGIAVVSSDEDSVTVLNGCSNYGFNAAVDAGYGATNGAIHACMANHIDIWIVAS